MANSAYDDIDEDTAARAPLSTHPAFPAIVALWFAALLGLGSLVLPATLFERAFAAARMASLLPLDFAERGAIAGGAALLGALLGWALARRLAAAHGRQTQPDRAEPRRPLRVREEVRDDPAPAEPRPAGRRRMLAMVSDETSTDPSRDAPYAEDSPYARDDAPFPDGEARSPDTDYGWQDAPVPAGDLDESAPEPAHEQPEPEPGYDREDIPAPHDEDERDAIVPEPSCATPPAPAVGPVSPARAPSPIAPESRFFRRDWDDIPSDQLSLVQLVERLGATLERRRALLADLPPAPIASVAPAPPTRLPPAPPAMPSPPPTPSDLVPTQFEEPAPAIEDYFGRSFAPVEDPEDEESEDEQEDPSAAFSLPLLRRPASRPAPREDDTGDDGDDGFGSLLAMRSSLPKAEPLLDIDEPDAFDDHAGERRPFDPPGSFSGAPSEPSDAATQPDGTDAQSQLRAALAALQRSRGAG